MTTLIADLGHEHESPANPISLETSSIPVAPAWPCYCQGVPYSRNVALKPFWFCRGIAT
jgi:hypothetical protein